MWWSQFIIVMISLSAMKDYAINVLQRSSAKLILLIADASLEASSDLLLLSAKSIDISRSDWIQNYDVFWEVKKYLSCIHWSSKNRTGCILITPAWPTQFLSCSWAGQATAWLPSIRQQTVHFGPLLSNLAVPCVTTRDCVLETELCGATQCVEQNHKFATCGCENWNIS